MDCAQQAHLGIHGKPEPAQIDKTGSHGCVRLTNWDAEELGAMVAPGVQVDFLCNTQKQKALTAYLVDHPKLGN